MDELIREAKEKLIVTFKSATDYEENKDSMLNFVNSEMSKRPDVFKLIGGNSLQMMYDNHRNHVNFMINVFKYSLFEMLVRIVPWVYKSYHNHDFSYDYFPIELETWKNAVKRFLPEASAKEINKTYEWMIEKHEKMVELSKSQTAFITPLEKKWGVKKDRFLSLLLNSDFESALQLAERFTKSKDEIENFYLKIVQPALYEIGNLWENGKISVAEEHLATAIVGRIMANIYRKFPKKKGRLKAIVASSPNEYHELGGRIVADLLEMDGWDVHFLGANVPSDELIKLVKKIKPKIIGISVTMPFNIEKAEVLIKKIKGIETVKSKIIVGGIAFNLLPSIYKDIGADFWASNAKEAVEIVSMFKD
ncbi:MAG: cobalamin-dependent protein [Thermodesulfovibrionales bacterium]|nr:cobalamin-dependent protein [Thermodesulfovibrionales bacterium]